MIPDPRTAADYAAEEARSEARLAPRDEYRWIAGGWVREDELPSEEDAR